MPSQAPRAGPFRFLDLPAEIRNQIYEYALHCDNGLCGDTYPKLYTNTSPPREPNPLKPVCRQLYAETRQTSLKYNDSYTFSGPDILGSYGDGGLGAFLAFQPMLRSSLCKNVSKIRIVPDALCSISETFITEPLLRLFASPEFALVEAFCKENPVIQIQFCFPHSQQSVTGQYHTHLMIAFIMRRLRRLPAQQLQLPNTHISITANINSHYDNLLAVMANSFCDRLRRWGYDLIPPENLRLLGLVDEKRDCLREHWGGLLLCDECWMERCPRHWCNCKKDLLELTRSHPDGY